MMKLNWLDENKIENPIRKHIQVIFKKVNDQVKGEIQRMIDSYHENRVEETLWK